MNHWWAVTLLLAALGLLAGCGDDDTRDPGEACEAWCWFIHDDVLEVDPDAIIEELPVESASVDWVISNCVINLSPEKERVFSEVHRVLRPGGRFAVETFLTDSDGPDAAEATADVSVRSMTVVLEGFETIETIPATHEHCTACDIHSNAGRA